MSKTEGPNSRNIPLPIQRAIRQRCGFGCVVCGLPLYEYEHMLGWANVHRHVAKEITLLCDRHHREKTAGLLPLDAVRKADTRPFNLRTGVSKPYDLHYSGDECEIVFGSNSFTTKDHGYGMIMVPLSIDGNPILSFALAKGHLLLTLNLFDEYNNPVLLIQNNQLFYSISPWDIQLTGRNLIIREASCKIFVDILFEAPNKIVINRGRFLYNGVEIIVRPKRALLTNNRFEFSGWVASGCSWGMVLGPHPADIKCIIRIGDIPRYLGDHAEANSLARDYLEQAP